jgi:hypothetical protein
VIAMSAADAAWTVLTGIFCVGLWWYFRSLYGDRPPRDPSLGVLEFSPMIKRVFDWTMLPFGIGAVVVGLIQALDAVL